MRIATLTTLLALALAGTAQAGVEPIDGGFRTRNIVEVAATPERAYAALGEVERWWNGAHTYSGDAANMSLPLSVGGCFCEKVGAETSRHGTVTLALPGYLLRLEAALGPLREEKAVGVLLFAFQPKGAGVEVEQTYPVGGLRPAAVEALAAAVDGVMREQLLRFEKYVETGRPE